MSKVEAGMYNPELKNAFLNEQYENEDSRKIVSYLFYNSRPTEEQLKKDLANFNINDIDVLMKDLDPPNSAVARSNGSVISTYINWAMGNGHRKAIDNPLRGIYPEWYDKFVGDKKLFMSKDELKDTIENIHNAQDAVIMQLLFEGVSGNKMSELLNLKQEDIDWDNNILHLEDDKFGKRDVEVTEDCLQLIQQAINQTIYYSKNGTATGRKAEIELVENEYVLRNIKTGAYSTGKGSPNLIYRRLTVISELFDLPYLTSKNLTKSGMIYEAYKEFVSTGTLDNDQISKIAEKFGVRKIKVREYEYYNTSILREFINNENIMKLYNIDIENN